MFASGAISYRYLKQRTLATTCATECDEAGLLCWQPPLVTGLDLRRKRVDDHVLDEQGQTVWVGVGSRSRVGREAGIKRQCGLGLVRKRSARLHEGMITVTVPDTLWATDATEAWTRGEGRCAVFVLVDHASKGCP